MQHAVDHRVLRKESGRPADIGQEHDAATREIRQGLDLVQELLELTIRG
jgi:hypothetical protein